MPDAADREQGLLLAAPALLDSEEPNSEVTPWSVISEEYGDFLIAVFEEWVRKDVGPLVISQGQDGSTK